MWHHTDRQDKIRITCSVELISQQIDRPTERHQPFHHEISHPSHIAYSLIDIIKYTKQETRDMFVTYLRVEKAYIDTALPTTHSSVWKTIIHIYTRPTLSQSTRSATGKNLNSVKCTVEHCKCHNFNLCNAIKSDISSIHSDISSIHSTKNWQMITNDHRKEIYISIKWSEKYFQYTA